MSSIPNGVVYINLSHRKDRKDHIERELQKLEQKNVHRIDAFLEPFCGHLGCGKSHVKALELAIEQNWDSVLIVEDDLIFKVDSTELRDRLNDLKNISWDVVLLGLGHHILKDSEYDFLKRIVRCTCAHGYIVRKHYYQTLLSNFQNAVEKMKNELVEHLKENTIKLNQCSAIDQEWFSLQEKDTFYVFVPELAVQKGELYSDNNCSIEHQQNKIRENGFN
jgi:GR25 family glycosyltransferase involved in LPS biosynthesis